MDYACTWAWKVSAYIKALYGTTYRANPALVRQTVQGCALAALFYRAETWFNRRLGQGSIKRI